MRRLSSVQLVALAALAVSSIVLSGCPSISHMTTARPIGDGKNDLTVSGGVLAVNFTALGSDDTDDVETAYVPTVDIMYRHGFGDSFDFGITVGGLGNVGVDFKGMLFGNETVALSLDPGVSGTFIGTGSVAAGYLQLHFPVLFDIVAAEWLTITLFPKYMGIYGFGTAEGSTVDSFNHYAGGGGGLEFKLAESFRLMPHATALVWANKPDGVSSTVWFATGLAAKFVF